MSWLNPNNWFSNSGGGMEDDFSADDYPGYAGLGRGEVRETVFDGGPAKTTTFGSWYDLDQGNPSGSYNWGGGPGVTGNNWANAFKAASSWNSSKGKNTPGYVSPYGMLKTPSPGVTKLGGSSIAYDPTASWWGKHQIYHHPQEQGGGGFLNKALAIGSHFAPPGVSTAMKVGSMLV